MNFESASGLKTHAYTQKKIPNVKQKEKHDKIIQ